MALPPSPPQSNGGTFQDGSRFRRWTDKVDYRLHKLENRRPKSSEVPWFYGSGVFGGDEHDLIIENMLEGSYATAGSAGGIYPDIRGLWQCTFVWRNVNDNGNEMAPRITSLHPLGQHRPYIPAGWGQASDNMTTTTVLAGPDPGDALGMGVSSQAAVNEGWGFAMGHLITAIDEAIEL